MTTCAKPFLDRTLELRNARMSDRQELERLKEQALSKLLDPTMSQDERRAMRQITPFDSKLIDDRTYFVAIVNGRVAASGGWSRRNALFCPSENGTQGVPHLDPESDAAIVRAMYTHPDFARQGLGSLILSAALTAARLAGFRKAQLIATTVGERLYRAGGWKTEEHVRIGGLETGGVRAVLMSRDL